MRENKDSDFDSLLTFSKLEVAEIQLERALRLFLDEADYVSAITLAGASEEILGKLLEQQGKPHSLGSLIDACVEIGRVVHKEEWSRKEFADIANYFRNGLKHYTDGRSITISREVAIEILDRAIDNLWELTCTESANIRRFMEIVHGT